MAVRSAPAEGGASHGGIIVLFTNRSAGSCYLSGYPGVAALDRAGDQLTQATRTLGGYLAGCGCTTPNRISLSPGASASSTIEGDNGGGNECLRGHALLVTPPNTTASTRLAYLDSYTCHLQVHPVVTGTIDRHA